MSSTRQGLGSEDKSLASTATGNTTVLISIGNYRSQNLAQKLDEQGKRKKIKRLKSMTDFADLVG